jgi:hypothetical protein
MCIYKRARVSTLSPTQHTGYSLEPPAPLRVQLSANEIRIDGLDFHAVSRLACDFFPAGKSFQPARNLDARPPHHKIIVSSRLYMRHCKMFIMREYFNWVYRALKFMVRFPKRHGKLSSAPPLFCSPYNKVILQHVL